MSDLNLSFLGPLLVTQNALPVTSFRSNKERALLAYLAEEGEHPHQRGSLIGLFWPEIPEQAARNNLSQTLGRLRRSLEADAPLSGYIEATRQQIQWNTSQHIYIDTRQFRLLLEDYRPAKKEQTDEVSNLETALQLYRGEFLQGLSLPGCEELEQWLLFKREHYHRLAVTALDQLANQYLTGARYADAQTAAHRHLTLEPWAESASRQLMRALALDGQRNAALAQYERCRELLMAELGIEPEGATTALYQQIQQGELGDGEAIAGVVVSPPPALLPLAHDWHEMPTLPHFFGRTAELAQLDQWLVADRCALVAILGIGGQGKTTLAAQIVPIIDTHFDLVIWRSLLNAPSLEELLAGMLPSLSGQQISTLPDTLDQQLTLFFSYLQQRRVLLVLDNLESMLQADTVGQYRPGYESYHQLLQGVATRQHQGQLLLTSRERPQGVTRWERDTPLVRSLRLNGLDAVAGHQLLSSRGVVGERADEAALSERYSGNPLALKLVADTVQELFGGDLHEFLTEETPVFSDVRLVLDQQFARLTDLEQAILFWLAIGREAMSAQALLDDLIHPPLLRLLLEALQALLRRSMIEQQGNGFSLQNVITEYLTARLVAEAVAELQSGELNRLHHHALLKATAKDYVRSSQLRLIAQPVVAQTVAHLGKSGTVAQFNAIVASLRDQTTPMVGYAAGNLLNLLLHLEVDLRGYDFSRLVVRQAYLQGHRLPQVNFHGADLTDSVFTHVFGLIRAIHYDTDEQLWIAGINANRLGLWSTTAGQFLQDYRDYGAGATVAAFSTDLSNRDSGTLLLASGIVGRQVRLWNIQETLERDHFLHTFVHRKMPWSLAFSPDGKLLASGTLDGSIYLWDVQTGSLQHILQEHTVAVTTLTFSPDGKQLASGDVDGMLSLWQSNTTEPRHLFKGHDDEVYALLFDSTGAHLFSGSYDRTIRVWDMQHHDGRGRLLQTLQVHTQFIRTLALSPDGRTLASGGGDTFVCLWDIGRADASDGADPDTGSGIVAQLRQRLHKAGPTAMLAFSPATTESAQRLAIVGVDLSVSIWDTQRGQSIETLEVYKDQLSAMAISPDGRLLAGGGRDGLIRLWDSMTDESSVHHFQPQIAHTQSKYARWIHTLAFSPPLIGTKGDATVLLASAGSDQRIHLWDAFRGHYLDALHGHDADVECIHFSPRTGNRLVSASRDQTLCLWDIQYLPDTATVRVRLTDTFYGHTDKVVTCAFSPDERFVVSGSLDRTLRLWAVGDAGGTGEESEGRAGAGQLLHTLVGHGHGVRTVVFSPNGLRLVSSSYDQSVIMWDVESGCALETLPMQDSTTLSMAFNPDGSLLAMGLDDHTICLWDVQDRRVQFRLSGHNSTVESVHFSPDGQWLASASEDGIIKRWAVAAAREGREICLQTVRVDGPYAGMQIASVTGISDAQKAALKSLGAVDE